MPGENTERAIGDAFRLEAERHSPDFGKTVTVIHPSSTRALAASYLPPQIYMQVLNHHFWQRHTLPWAAQAL